MNKRIILIGSVLGVAAAVSASSEFLETFMSTYKVAENSALGEKSCGICHVSDSDFKLNPYGKQVAHELVASGASEVTPAILKKVELLDADKDGISNIDRIKAGQPPWDSNAKPVKPAVETKPVPTPTAPTDKAATAKPQDRKTEEAKEHSEETTAEEAAEHPTAPVTNTNVTTPSQEGDETTEAPEPPKAKPLVPKNAFHPAIVHFPIALFIAGLVLDLFGLIGRNKALLLAGWYNLVLAAISSLVAVGTGVAAMGFIHLPYKGLIFQHLLYAVGAAFTMWIMVSLRVHRHEEMNIPLRVAYFVLAAVGLVFISYAGHLGGVFVYGE